MSGRKGKRTLTVKVSHQTAWHLARLAEEQNASMGAVIDRLMTDACRRRKQPLPRPVITDVRRRGTGWEEK